MTLKTIAIGLNVLLLMLCARFFIGHGLPKSLMLWSSAILWAVAPMLNLQYIRKNQRHFKEKKLQQGPLISIEFSTILLLVFGLYHIPS